MFDYAGYFGAGDYQIVIGGGGGSVYIPPGTIPGTTPGTIPQIYQSPALNTQNQQILMIGLVLLAVVLLTRK